jgi:FAD binding domain-containing protein/berberine-like enzyme
LNRRKAIKLGLAVGAAGFVPPAPVAGKNRNRLTAASGTLLPAYNLRTQKIPKTILQCRTTVDVIDAVKYVREHQTPFSILSSGHCFEGFSHSEHTVIDLRAMQSIKVDQQNLATAQPGTTIGKAQSVLAERGRVLSAGLCQTVALGGHLGCGGIGYLSRKAGLLCDQLVAAEMVNAEGKVIRASEEENAGLFWALRGGGPGSYGIVTQAVFRTVPSRKTTYLRAFWNLPIASAASFYSGWQNWSQQLPSEISTTMIVGSNDLKNIFFKIEIVSVATTQETRKWVLSLMRLGAPAIDPEVFQGSYQQVSEVFSQKDFFPSFNAKFGSNFLSGTTSKPVILAALQAILKNPIPRLSIFIERLGGQITAQTDGAFAHRDSAFLIQYAAKLISGPPEEDQLSSFRVFRDIFAPSNNGAAYCGYPDTDLQDWQTAYWGENFARLRQIKREYDPGNVFDHAQSIPPATV